MWYLFVNQDGNPVSHHFDGEIELHAWLKVLGCTDRKAINVWINPDKRGDNGENRRYTLLAVFPKWSDCAVFEACIKSARLLEF